MSLAELLSSAEIQHERLLQSNLELGRTALSRLSIVDVYSAKSSIPQTSKSNRGATTRQSRDKSPDQANTDIEGTNNKPSATTPKPQASNKNSHHHHHHSHHYHHHHYHQHDHSRHTDLVFVFRTRVETPDCNSWDTMHGGCVATLFNAVGKIVTGALAGTRPRVSTTDLVVNYIAPALVGSDIVIECQCVKMGRSIAFLHSRIWDYKHRLLYYASQTVAISY
ncbi:hypothetical protein EV182_003035 [Spiromyces aspiralis]|uniref:Uncharacterized protein n=1 Tax=Spiromyces aspiralis TaxID=68401 RepID=A0ACC1HQZ2_9FUNG|nr:hypothetical protein EV182_003035 [Spiromyces aspiralis]